MTPLAKNNAARQTWRVFFAFQLCALVTLISGQARTLAGNRSTNDAGRDLVESLVQASRWEDAKWICARELATSAEGRFEYSRWTARLSMVLAEENAAGLFGNRPSELRAKIRPAVAKSCEPIDRLLSSYPNLEAKDFLVATKLHVRRTILRAVLVAASVSPPDEELSDVLLREVSLLQDDAESLHRDARARLVQRSSDNRSRGAEEIDVAQYERLLQELAVGRVSIAMLQTELFEAGTADYGAAASEAVTLAKEALLSLPDGIPAKRKANELLAEASIRSRDFFNAEKLLADPGAREIEQGSPTWASLRVRLALAKGNVDVARRYCDAFYASGLDGLGDANTLQMDFAMLECLLAGQADDDEITRWIDLIAQRGGAFARRRAESIAIGTLRRDRRMGTNSRNVSPALIAAQGEDLLRRNQPAQAAKLLREAALSSSDPALSFQYAAKSAASAVAASDRLSAIEVLRAVSQKQVSDEKAPAMMMQAALLASRPFQPADDPEKRLAVLESTLRELSQTWPASDSAVKANAWLCKVLAATGRKKASAQVALELLTLRGKVDQLEYTANRLFEFLSGLDAAEATVELRGPTGALAELAGEREALVDPILRMGAWLFDRQQLSELRAKHSDGRIGESFFDQLLAFRSGEGDSIDVSSGSESELARARWRLERDALLDASEHAAIGTLLMKWPGQTEWESAVANFWARPDDASIDTIKRIAWGANDDRKLQIQAMTILGSSASSVAKQAAVEFSDRIAATMKIGSDAWYSEKLRGIRYLIEAGEGGEAKKRAKYVLLLHRPEGEALRVQFERAAADSN